MRRRRRRGRSAYFGVTEGGNFEDPHTGYRGNILHVVDRAEDRPTAVERAVPRAARRACHARAAGPRRQGAARLERAVPRRRSPRPRSCSGATTGWTRHARTRASCSRELRRDDGRLLRSWQDGRAHLLAYAEDYAALLEALLTLAEVDDVAWLAEAQRVADDLVRLFADDGRRRVLHDRRRRRRAHRAPEGRRGQRHAVGELARRPRAAPARRAHRRRGRDGPGPQRWIATIAPVMGEHPTAFAYLLARARAARPRRRSEVAIVGDRGDPGRAALVAELRTPPAPVVGPGRGRARDGRAT